MCGFIVSLSKESNNLETIKEFLELISHRGLNKRKTLFFKINLRSKL